MPALSSPAGSSLLRRLARGGALVVLTLLGIELVARLSFAAFTGESYDAARLAAKRGTRLEYLAERLGESPDAGYRAQEVASGRSEGGETDAGALPLLRLHPYLGFVGREGARPWQGVEVAYNSFGMLSTEGYDYPYEKSGDEFVVGVFGGSVAEGFANLGAEELARTLHAEAPELSDRPIVVLPLALGGYKQPQQLILLQYALLTGFEMDVALNLDGYNEVVLAAENAERGVGLVDPSGGHYELLVHLGGSTIDPQLAELLVAVGTEQRRERDVLQLVDTWPLRHSAFAALVAELWTEAVAARTRELNQALSERALAEGPGAGSPEEASESRADAVAVWSRASEMMHAIARREGLVYVHALQPNQYVEGSKPLTSRELQIAYSPANPWSVWATRGYPRLREEGAAMRERGTPFYDTTQVFREVEGDLYTDDCCHFSRKGHEILARAIGEAIAGELAVQALGASR